jgi:hypothetical protein
MLIHAVETYLAVRRAADCKLDAVAGYLRNFAQCATAQGDTHVVPTPRLPGLGKAPRNPNAITDWVSSSGWRVSAMRKTPAMRCHRNGCFVASVSTYALISLAKRRSRLFWLRRLDLAHLTPYVPRPITRCWPCEP